MKKKNPYNLHNFQTSEVHSNSKQSILKMHHNPLPFPRRDCTIISGKSFTNIIFYFCNNIWFEFSLEYSEEF